MCRVVNLQLTKDFYAGLPHECRTVFHHSQRIHTLGIHVVSDRPFVDFALDLQEPSGHPRYIGPFNSLEKLRIELALDDRPQTREGAYPLLPVKDPSLNIFPHVEHLDLCITHHTTATRRRPRDEYAARVSRVINSCLYHIDRILPQLRHLSLPLSPLVNTLVGHTPVEGPMSSKLRSLEVIGNGSLSETPATAYIPLRPIVKAYPNLTVLSLVWEWNVWSDGRRPRGMASQPSTIFRLHHDLSTAERYRCLI